MVAQTILQQLGGRRFQAMTGARNFVGSSDALMFSIPKAKNGINKIKIVLTPADTYDVEGYRITRATVGFEPLARVEGIYADNLRRVFESITGLATSL